MPEMLDIVDEADVVVAQATREAVHAGNHLHRATHMLLINSSAQVYVQLRSQSKDMNPGLWDTSAAGQLGVQVAAEELQEFMRLSPTAENGFEFVRVYWVQSDGAITLEASEIDDGRWVGVAELNSWLENAPEDFTPDFHHIWQNARTLALFTPNS